MKLSDIAKVIVDMEGWMPEDARARLATHMLTAISEAMLRDQGGARLEQWQADGGPQAFLHWCKPTVPPRTVAHSDKGYDRENLHGFIDSWRRGTTWQTADGGDNRLTLDRDRELIDAIMHNLELNLGADMTANHSAEMVAKHNAERLANERFQELVQQLEKKGAITWPAS